MNTELTSKLNTFLGLKPLKTATSTVVLSKLLEDATMLILMSTVPFETPEWLQDASVMLDSRPSNESEELFAQLRIAVTASNAPAAGKWRLDELEELDGALSTAIKILENGGAVESASIGHLVAGHVFLYARDANGFRTYFLEEAEKHFAAAENSKCSAMVQALAKVRLGEISLLNLSNVDSAKVIASHKNFADAIEILQKTTDNYNSNTTRRIQAQAIVSIGTSSYLLSQIGGEHGQVLREHAIDHLAGVVEQTSDPPIGKERWAKAAFTLFLAWLEESNSRAIIFSETGAGGQAFSDADDTAKLVLHEIVRTARKDAPEIWAMAHLNLAQIEAQYSSGVNTQDILFHFQEALNIFGELECPEIWSKINGEVGTFLYNNAMLQRDSSSVEASLLPFKAAANVNDPIRDTKRNALLQWANILKELDKPGEAVIALKQAMEAGEFVLARALSIPAQRAESGILSGIVKDLALLLIKTGSNDEAFSHLLYAIELDFAYGLLFQPQPPGDAEGLDRRLLGLTANERKWNNILPYTRTEHELNTIRLQAGQRLAVTVQGTLEQRRRIVSNYLEKISLEKQVPFKGALVVPILGSRSVFLVLLHGRDKQVIVVPATFTSRSTVSEAIFGVGMSEGWLTAYLRSLGVTEKDTDFGGQPAVLSSKDRIQYVHFLPNKSVDSADSIPKARWISALDQSVRATWHIIEPLHNYLQSILQPGAPVVIMGEPLLAMLPLAAAWDRRSGETHDLAEFWSFGLIPAPGILPSPESKFSIEPGDASLVVIDPTGSLAFAWWEYVAITAAQPNLEISAIGERRPGIKKDFLDAVGGASIHHFACHARYENDDPLDSYIDLGEGQKLTAREIIAELKLVKSKLVVLSACESGMIKTSVASPERYIGLASAFLKAGAERVICTLWSVNDLSTMLMMQALYEELTHQPPIIALRKAQLRIRDMSATNIVESLRLLKKRGAEMPRTSSQRVKNKLLDNLIGRIADLPEASQPFQHPYYWAAFVHYGAPR